MQGSKIRLSPAEAALFSDAGIILTKNSILQKTVALLAEVQGELAQQPFPHAHLSTPKISKGENYLGLPYAVLDYPRIVAGDGLFFIRSMFWWGNFFSSTLQVSGSYKESNIQFIAAAYDEFASQNFYVGINQDPWQHHFETTNYRRIGGLSNEAFRCVLQKQPHIKIAARWPLSEWDAAATNLIESWRFLAAMIRAE
jgi:hypothetical protein